MSYPRAMFTGMTTLIALFLPGYIYIRENLGWSGWKTFLMCAGALIPWTVFCIVLDVVINLFRRESAFSAELIHSPIFVLYFGVPSILIYEWLGLKWFLVAAGTILGVFILSTLLLAFFSQRFIDDGEEKDAEKKPSEEK